MSYYSIRESTSSRDWISMLESAESWDKAVESNLKRWESIRSIGEEGSKGYS